MGDWGHQVAKEIKGSASQGGLVDSSVGVLRDSSVRAVWPGPLAQGLSVEL